MNLLQLFLTFLYVGTFTVGGGLASIPFIMDTLVRPGIISEDFLFSMLGISQSLPGAIGINLATYIGYEQFGVPGGIVTALGIVIPCFLISFIVSRVFMNISESKGVKAAFYGIRAVVCGLIATAAYSIMEKTGILNFGALVETGNVLSIFNWQALAIFAILLFGLFKFKKHPVVYVALGGLFGVIFFM